MRARFNSSVSMLSVVGLATGVLAIAAACRAAPPPEADAPTWEELPPPSWRVVARRAGAVVLAAQRVIVRGIPSRDDRGRDAGAESAPEYPTLLFEGGRLREGPVARAEPHVLASGATRDTLRLYALELHGRQVLFAQAGEAPSPNESPVEPGLYVLEHDDRLWLLGGSGTARLTADTVRGIARDTLRSQTGEAGPHLFWATHPLWSPDGSTIAYVTNRTWMLGREGGQEVWLADVRPRRERPLLSESGEYFLHAGWLGEEVVYRAREGGISAVDVRSGRRRAIAPGSVEAFAPRGARMLYMTSAGDTVRAHVLTEHGVVDVPGPPPGERLDHGGTFSPSGDRVVLGASVARDSGITRALYVFDLGAQRLTPLSRWSFREGSRHPHGLPEWLDDSTLLLTQFDRRTGLESSTLVRLPPAR
jgi:hypothetical protein